MNGIDPQGKNMGLLFGAVVTIIIADAVVDWVNTEEESYKYDPETEIGTLSEGHSITPILPIRADLIINSSSDDTADSQIFFTISGQTFDLSGNPMDVRWLPPKCEN